MLDLLDSPWDLLPWVLWHLLASNKGKIIQLLGVRQYLLFCATVVGRNQLDFSYFNEPHTATTYNEGLVIREVGRFVAG